METVCLKPAVIRVAKLLNILPDEDVSIVSALIEKLALETSCSEVEKGDFLSEEAVCSQTEDVIQNSISRDSERKYESDAEWYFRKDPERDLYNKYFFQFCRQYYVRWAAASPKERAFIEEITRVTYEKDKARRLGLPLSDVRPFFGPSA